MPRVHVVKHGTRNEYNNFGCRCDECRQANSNYYLRKGFTEKMHQRRRANNLCIKCGEPITKVEGRKNIVRCIACSNQSNNYQRRVRNAAKKN